MLARDVMDTGNCAARYARYGSRHTSGMVARSDRYHIDKLVVVVADRPGNPISLFMSPYRSGRRIRSMPAKSSPCAARLIMSAI